MKKILYYGNGGSGNHGCEAITRSLTKILGSENPIEVFSSNYIQDKQYGIDSVVKLIDLNSYHNKDIDYWLSYLRLKFLKDKFALDFYPYLKAIKSLEKPSRYVALSIGGDNYCYGGTDYYRQLDQLFHKHHIPTAMVGCSIEPEVIKDSLTNEDLRSHSLIIARESLTYNALLENGIENVKLCPDPAFVLNTGDVELPAGFETGNTIGINLSPYVEKCGNGENIIYKNAINLIQYIIDNTDYKIALIPNVVWSHSNDFEYMSGLYEKFKNTGRIIMFGDMDAESLKGIISKCTMFITARTHASIAAYSTNVPTLVIGYSIKAKGIAKDLFGTYDNYVLPTQEVSSPDALIDSFLWLKDNKTNIKKHLISFMPEYKDLTKNIKPYIYNLTEGGV